ncbi:MAG TPA: polysaccharide biosynthesis tyrosine autokinase [Gemmatimonadales bacterium]|nr:polysaccharide biosynthesis tyrosine autokinase [Gemmatimonadales bacterium]
MSRLTPVRRELPGSAEPPLRPIEANDSGDSVSFRQVFTVLRRRYPLILAMTLIGTSIGVFLASREPPTYHATALLRFAGERRALTGDEAEGPSVSKTADPIESIMQLIRSRTVAAAVVDTLGLQLQSWTPEFSTADLAQIHVDSRAVGDSVNLTFRPTDVVARRADRTVTAPYGQLINLGVVQFAVPSRPSVEMATLGISGREPVVDGLLGGLMVTRRTETDVIDIGYTAASPVAAQQIVNATVQSFQSLNIQWARERSRRRREFLAEQLAQTDSMLARAQAELSSFRSRQQIANSRDKLAAEQGAQMQLEAQIAGLQSDRQTFGTLQRELKSSDEATRSEALRTVATAPGMSDNAAIGGIYHQLLQYQDRLDSMLTGPFKASKDNPDVVQLQGLKRSTEQRLTDAVTSQTKTLDARIGALTALRRSSGASMELLPAMAEEEMRLSRRVEQLAGTSDAVRKDFQQARMSEAVEAGDVDVVDLADVPYAPVLTASALKLALGLFLGLLLGLVIAYLLEALNTSVRRPEDLESVLHVPGLAVIPRISGGGANGRGGLRGLLGPRKTGRPDAGSPMSGGQTFSIGIEAFRNLRTSLIWSDGGEALKTLVVTSAAPGEGKTLTAANLAVTLAYDGLRVLLVDCDIRRPRVHGMFKVPRAPGLMELLTSSHAPGSSPVPAIRETSIAGLSVLPCGALPSNAANLLSGTRMRVLLQELREQFDIIVLDTPPVLATADAGIVASLTDGVLLVVRAGTTDRNAAQRACQQLANVGARVIGTVLNDPGGQVAKEGDYYYPYDYAAEEQ